MKKNLGAVFVLATAVLLASCGGTTDSSSSGNASSSETTSSSTPASSSESSSSSESNSSSSSSESIPEPVEDVTGSGTESDPYLVNTLAGLESIRDDIQNVSVTTYVELMADLDLSGQQWTPLGNFETAANVVFDGNGHVVEGLTITSAIDEEGELALGFFGAATGTIMNLTVEGDITLNPLASGTYAGLVAGYGSNLYLQNVHSSGSVAMRTLGSSQALYAGGIVGFAGALDSYYVDILGSSSTASVSARSEYVGYAGGIAGAISTNTYSIGISSINSCLYSEGTVVASTAAGGIVGSTLYYASVVNSVSNAASIEVTGEYYGTSAAGGIVGSSYYENAFLFNLVKTTTYKGEEGSNIGTVAGELCEDGYEYGTDLLGAVSYGNIGPSDTYTEDDLKKIGFGAAYDLHGTDLPTLKADPTISGNGTLTVHSNDGTERSKEIPFALGLFNESGAASGFTSEAGLLVGESYDPDTYLAYRWYAPLNADIDLYDAWYDPSPIVGWHLGSSSYNPEIYFGADGSYVMMEYDGHSQTGTYWTNGSYLIFEGGNYSGIIVTLGDGTLSFPDVNDDSYTYEYSDAPLYYGYYSDGEDYTLYLGTDGKGYVNDGMSKLDVTWRTEGTDLYITVSYYDEAKVTVDGDTISFTLNDYDNSYSYTLTAFDGIPTYDGGYVGFFHGEEFDYRLYADGNVDIYRNGNDSVYYTGGYRAFGSDLEMDAWGLSATDFRYDDGKGLIYATDGSSMMAKEGTYLDRYATKDSTLVLFRFALEGGTTATYVVKNGRLSDLAVEGTIENGATITIGGESYLVEGTLLTPASDIGVDTSDIAGTYELKLPANEIAIVINDDGTGTYDGEPIEFAWDGTTLSFEYNYITYTLTYNEGDGTFAGTMDDGEYQFDCTMAIHEVVDTTAIAGTYDLSVNGNSPVVVTINDDGTGTYDGAAVEFAWDGTTLAFEYNYLAYSLTYNAEDGTFAGTMNDGEYDYAVTMAAHVESLDFESLAGNYTLHLPYNDLEVVIRADGTGTCDGSEVTFEINGATLSWQSNYIDYEVTYENGQWNGTYDDGDYVFEITMEYVGPLEESGDETTASTLVGTWSGKLYSGVEWTIEVKEDGTLTLAVAGSTYNGTWAGDLEGTISFSVPDFSEPSGTMTLDSDGTASVSAEDWDYYTYNLDMTKVA